LFLPENGIRLVHATVFSMMAMSIFFIFPIEMPLGVRRIGIPNDINPINHYITTVRDH
jgi:hypothetical protein